MACEETNGNTRALIANEALQSSQFLKQLASMISVAAEALETVQPELDQGLNFYDEVRRFEAGLIERALRQTGGNQSKAARLLQLKQTTLHGKIKHYNIQVMNQIYSSVDPPESQLGSRPISPGEV